MGTILLIILLVLLFGGGGGYYAHGRYGGAGLGGVIGLVVLVLVFTEKAAQDDPARHRRIRL